MAEGSAASIRTGMLARVGAQQTLRGDVIREETVRMSQGAVPFRSGSFLTPGTRMEIFPSFAPERDAKVQTRSSHSDDRVEW